MFNDLYEYYVEDMPYGTAKARTGDPYQWIEEHFLNDLGRHTPAPVTEGAVHNFLDKMSAAARNFFHRLANKSGCSFETLMWRLSALDPDTFSVQDIAGLIHCSERSARSIANIAVRQGIFNKNGNSYSLAKREVTEVRVAAKVAKSKEENPENFCKVKNCLWRTKEDFCPKHAKKEAVKESTTNRKSGPWSKK